MRVCLLAEGCYPYVVGGVSSWVQMLIQGMPEHEFIIYAIGAEEKNRGNFKYTLPKESGDLAQEITKDPYNFDFVAIRQGYDEKELKDTLMDNVQNFLMELGTGFAFVGREYRLQVGNTEQYIDMLFYNIKRHCYVVVEVKVVDFEPGFISQTATYVSAVNHTLKNDGDTQTIGILICKTKDNILAKYAVETSTEPIGISEYELNALMPKDFKGTLPTIEELEQGLSEDY